MMVKIKKKLQDVEDRLGTRGKNPLLIKPGSIHQYSVEKAMETGSRIFVFSYNASQYCKAGYFFFDIFNISIL